MVTILVNAPSPDTPPPSASQPEEASAEPRAAVHAAARRVLADQLRNPEGDTSGREADVLRRALLTALPDALATGDLTVVEPLAAQLGALAHRYGLPLAAVVTNAHRNHTHTMDTLIGHLDHPDHAVLVALLEISHILRDLSDAALAGYQDAALALLREQTLTDGLTGIANRRAFDSRLADEVERAERFGHGIALVLLDIDGLKRMNDTRGHAYGDALISAVAALLRDQARGIDLVARIGGDEFAVIVPEADRGGADALVQRLARTARARQVHGVPLRVSMGVAVYPDNGPTPAALIARADRLMYTAKRRLGPPTPR